MATFFFSILAACSIGFYLAYCCFSRVRRSRSFSYGPVPSNTEDDEDGGYYDRQAPSYAEDSDQESDAL